MKKTRGSMMIEAAFVFPIVFIVITFLIISAVYVSHRIMLESKIKKIALILSKEFEHQNIYKAYTNNNLFGYKVDENQVVQSYANPQPYRLFFGSKFNQSAIDISKSDLQKSLFGASLVVKDIKEVGNILQKKVEIVVEYRFSPFKLFEYIAGSNELSSGIKSEVKISVPVLGGTEFVRNIDVARSVIGYFFKGKSDEKIDLPMNKLKEYLKDLISPNKDGGKK